MQYLIEQIEDVLTLKKGDEIIVPFQGRIRKCKLLKDVKTGKKTHWRTKKPLASSVKCLIAGEETEETSNRYTWDRTLQKSVLQPYTYINRTFDMNKEYGITMYVNLNDREILKIVKL